MTTELSTLLSNLDACEPACEWAEGRDLNEETWLACERGDWLLWLLAKLNVSRPRLVLAACACARLSLCHVPAGEMRPLRAIEIAEAWARGGANAPSLADVRSAAFAAYAAYAAAYAAYAAYAAAYAAYAAAYAADAADAAAYAATYAADAARAARATTWRKCADLVRERFTWTEVAALINP